MNYRTLTRDDVQEVADLLISKHGETTTLNIKQALRKRNFFATQQMVSNIMIELEQEGHYLFKDDGHHRTYYTSHQLSKQIADVDMNTTSDDEEEDKDVYVFKVSLPNCSTSVITESAISYLKARNKARYRYVKSMFDQLVDGFGYDIVLSGGYRNRNTGKTFSANNLKDAMYRETSAKLVK